MKTWLAVDQGGQSSRAMLFDSRGGVVDRAQRRVGEHRLRAGWVEQDPEELVGSIGAAVDEVLERCDALPAAAGLATQRSSIVCWSREDGRALSPVLSWQDRRNHAWLDTIADRAEWVHERTGLYLSAHYGASKLRWCLEHLAPVREALQAGTLVCGPLGSFLAYRLLDENPLRIDPANAARTLLWSLWTMDWDDELLELFGVPRQVLPRCGPTRQDFGTLTSHGRSVPLVIVNGDQSAALFAHGMPRDDTAYVNLGTGAFIQARVDSLPPALPRLLAGVVHQDEHRTVRVIEGTVNGGASALQRVAADEGLADADYQQPLHGWLNEPGEPPLFLNGVSGLGSPFWVPDFSSRFVGDGDSAARLVAVIESIAFLIQQNLDALRTIRAPFSRMRVTGGLSWYDGLCRRLANLSGLPVERPAEYEATARGTAYLVADAPEEWQPGSLHGSFTPTGDAALRDRYARWRRELTRALLG